MRATLLLILSAFLVNQASAACAPEKLARILFRDASPGVDRESFEGQPTLLYRMGARFVRIEEAVDFKNGIHGLSITAEPDAWLINLATKTGQHIRDRVKPFVVHAQVFGSPEDPEILRSFEFGCELEYMKARNVHPVRSVVGGFTLDNYKVTEGVNTVGLSIIAGTERPLVAVHLINGKVVTMYQYIQYDLGLQPDRDLFEPPEGITMKDAN